MLAAHLLRGRSKSQAISRDEARLVARRAKRPEPLVIHERYVLLVQRDQMGILLVDLAVPQRHQIFPERFYIKAVISRYT